MINELETLSPKAFFLLWSYLFFNRELSFLSGSQKEYLLNIAFK